MMPCNVTLYCVDSILYNHTGRCRCKDGKMEDALCQCHCYSSSFDL
jgi:hypothetical protein